jgi:hypothetical protein
MEKKKFNELVKSIKQAGKIKRLEPLEEDLPYKPVAHDHEAFLKKAMKRKDFRESYDGNHSPKDCRFGPLEKGLP